MFIEVGLVYCLEKYFFSLFVKEKKTDEMIKVSNLNVKFIKDVIVNT